MRSEGVREVRSEGGEERCMGNRERGRKWRDTSI